jgi:hypothetical protein
MTPDERPVEINMSGIPASGIGGLGLVVIALLMTVELPEARWLLVIGATGGLGLGALLIFARRRYRTSAPSGDDPTILFRSGAVAESDRESARVRLPKSERSFVAFAPARVTIPSAPVPGRS